MKKSALRYTLSVLAVAVMLSTARAETVSLRMGETAGGARLVFDWDQPVTYTASLVDSKTLSLVFSRPLTLSAAQLKMLLPHWIGSITNTAQGKKLLLALKQPATLSSFTVNDKVVIDLASAASERSPVKTDESQPAKAPGVKPETEGLNPSAGPAPSGEHPLVDGSTAHTTNSSPIIPPISPALSETSTATSPHGPTQPPSPPQPLAPPEPEHAPHATLPTSEPKVSVAPSKGVVENVPLAVVKTVGENNNAPLAVVVPLTAKTNEPASVGGSHEPSPPADPMLTSEGRAHSAALIAAPNPLLINDPKESFADASLTFTQPTALAVFKRGSSLYLVTNTQGVAQASDLVGPELGHDPRVSLVPSEGGAVVRLSLADKQPLRPQISLADQTWQITFQSPNTVNLIAIPVEKQPTYSLGPRVLVKTQTGPAVKFTDPLIGDTLIALPVLTPSMAVVENWHFPQADMIQTFQGVVVAPLADGIDVVTNPSGVEISAKNGFKLANGPDENGQEFIMPQEAQTPAASSGEVKPYLPPLFDFHSLGEPAGPDFIQKHQDLQTTIMNASKEKKGQAQLDLAHFYFINGMPTEAASVWSLAIENQPDWQSKPEYTLTKAIAAFSSGTVAEAEKTLETLSIPTLDSVLWTGMAAAKDRDWAKAYTFFKQTRDRMPEYPEPYLSRLQIAAIEAALNNKDNEMAESLLLSLSGRQRASGHGLLPSAEYLTGLLAWQEDRNDEARAHFSVAAQSWDQLWRVRSQLALIDADLKEGRATPEDALRRLERLRYAWRGDALEFDMFYELSGLYARLGDYPAAFESYANLAKRFPKDPRTPSLDEERKALFARVFQSEDRDKVPAYSQIALWDRYPTFRPTQKDVLDSLELYLADRSAGIDLLDQSLAFHQHVLDRATDPVKRASMGATMAGLALINNKPADALSYLKATAPTEPSLLSDELTQERKLLQARAIFKSGKPDDALNLMNNDYSEAAMSLRADITWQSKRWAEAAAVLNELIGQPPVEGGLLDAQQRAMVLNRAVALLLAGDTVELEKLRENFSPAMEKSPDAVSFKLLTRTDGSVSMADRARVMNGISEVELYQKFLDRYKGAPASAAEDKTTASAPGSEPTTSSSDTIHH